MQQRGIYEQLITQLIAARLDREKFYVGERELEKSEASLWLSRYLGSILEYALSSIPSGNEQLQTQIELANQLLFWLKERLNDERFLEENLLDCQGKILTALFETEDPVAADLKKHVARIFPETGLTQSELFSGSNAGPSLESELKREILSADKICWLVSFIKWTGIRIFRRELEEFTASGRELKIITTSYMGATDAKAVEFLATLPNTQIKLSYNTQSERLHAKSYLFLRHTGFHTGYIGSSNLSHSALTSGLEWNLKITSQEIPHIIEKTVNTFEAYWQSNDFEIFDGQSESKAKLNLALKQARGSGREQSSYHFDIKPFPHQQEILENLTTERQMHHRFKNLVVAATGTGKTLISAFDFARFSSQHPNSTFLFIAHREEILRQAQAAYRGVLRNSNFGELWVGGAVPGHYRQLFVSVQTLNNQLSDIQLTAEFYDYIVIDEVHHISAASYRSAISHFNPKILLGLTATPERHDGGNILDDFCGVIAAELRLPEAINRRHLCPFQYFAVDDDTDLSQIPWSRGRYDIAKLTNLYTHNQARVDRILQSLHEIVTDIDQIRALAFCVSRVHADFMCRQFLLKDIKCDILTSDNSQERQQKQQAIRSGEISVLFVVDIFNEGIDIPEVDTLLFLRPTESLTIFLQQLGRGLRLAEDKECCTVLDFVGNSNPNYDYSNKFRALTGKTNRPITEEITKGFSQLPLGCRIELSKKAQAMVLSHIRQSTLNLNRLLGLIRQFPSQTSLPLTLTNFLAIHDNVTIEDIYKRGSWSSLVTQAIESSVREAAKDDNVQKAYERAINTRLLVCDCHNYLSFLSSLVSNNFTLEPSMDRRLALMCHYDFWQKNGPSLNYKTLEQSLKSLDDPVYKKELSDLLCILVDRIQHQQTKMTNLPLNPIKLHARYAREQVLVAFGATSFDKQLAVREGVLFIKEQNIELLFVTLKKSEKQFSPATMYHDYALNEESFHWQSQNSARPDKGKGLSYIQQRAIGKRLFLFVREQSKDEYGRTMGFVNFGEVDYVSHTGSQPMDIIWQLLEPMPSSMWNQAAKLSFA